MNSYTLKKFEGSDEYESIIYFRNQREKYAGYLDFDLVKFKYYQKRNETSIYLWTLSIVNPSWNYGLDYYSLLHLKGVRQFLDV